MAAKSFIAQAKIAIDDASYHAGIRRAIKDTERLGRATKKANAGNPFGKMGKSAIRAAAGVASIYGAYSFLDKSVKDTVKLAKATRALQRATGLAAEDASQLAAVLQVRGVEGVAAGRAFTTLARQTRSAADGSKTAAKAFRELGVSQQAIKSGNVQEILAQSADGFKKLGDGQAKAALAQQLFGRGAKDIIPLLEGGSKALREQLGIAPKLTDAQVKQSLKAIGAQRKLELAMLDVKTTIGTALMPTISDAADKLAQFVGEFREGEGAGGAFRDTLRSIKDSLAPIVAFLIAHPQLLRDAAAAYVAFKVTVGGLNLATTLATVFPTGKWAENKGKNLGKYLGKGLILGLLLAIPFFAQEIGKAISEKFPSLAKFSGSNKPGGLLNGAAWGELGKLLGSAFKASLRAAVTGLVALVSGPVGLALAYLKRKVGSWRNVGTLLAESLKAAIRSGLAKLGGIVAGAVSRAYQSVSKKVKDFVTIGGSLASGLARGIANSANLAVTAAKNLAGSLPKWVKKTLGIDSPSKVFADLGKNVVAGMAAGMKRTNPIIKAADAIVSAATNRTRNRFKATFLPSILASFGAAAEVRVANAETALTKAEKAKDRKSARGKARISAARTELNAANRQQTQQQSKATIRDFISSLVDKVRDAKFADLTSRVQFTGSGTTTSTSARRNQISAAQAGRSVTSAQRRYADALRESTDPKVQERFARKKEQLARRLRAAEATGNLELIDSVKAELDTLNARYGPDYLTTVREELDSATADATEANATLTADAFAAEFEKKMEELFKNLLQNGGVQSFFAGVAALLNSMTGSTGAPLVPPSSLGDGTAGLPAAVGAVGGTEFKPTALQSKILAKLKADKNHSMTATQLKAAIKGNSTKASVWSAWSGIPVAKRKGYKVQNKASGGYLQPGALTMVGETGRELVMATGNGAEVISATRTKRLGAGATNITINAVGAAANDPQLLARELGWQLATR